MSIPYTRQHSVYLGDGTRSYPDAADLLRSCPPETKKLLEPEIRERHVTGTFVSPEDADAMVGMLWQGIPFTPFRSGGMRVIAQIGSDVWVIKDRTTDAKD